MWFAGNAILPDLIAEFGMQPDDISNITSAVQAGFIAGTLVFAFAAIADRFSPSKVFFTCSILGALFNTSIYFLPQEFFSVLASRFLTGVMLAGIYPVGMKIAADWYKDDLGKAIGYLVGALVLGTAFPNLIRALGSNLDWSMVLMATSILAITGGLLVLILIKDGPYRHTMPRFNPTAIIKLFRSKGFRASSFGYFGHMWELYTFWAFTPLLLERHSELNGTQLNIPLWTFFIIGSGFLGSSIGGIVSRTTGSAFVAWFNLLGSGICIFLFPFFIFLPQQFFLPYMLLWGWLVVGDSPQFSALVAGTAPKDQIGSGLTIMNCIGFSLSIISIYFLNYLMDFMDIRIAVLMMLIGPAVGLIAIYPLKPVSKKNFFSTRV